MPRGVWSQNRPRPEPGGRAARFAGRVEHDRCARALADAVTAYLVSPTPRHGEAMHEALTAFTEARKALDA